MTVIINGTSGITGVSGSSANPAINSDGDTNTGVFFPAADKVGIVTGGTEIMRVSSAGVELNGSTSGSVTLSAPAVAGASIFTFPVVVSTDTLVSLAATQTLTNKSLIFQNNLSATATAGAIEYDGTVFYGTPQGAQRGIIPAAQFFRLESNLAGTNVNTVQSVFGVSVTLSTSTVYAFEAIYYFNKTAGVTSHTLGIGYGGSATLNSILWGGLSFDGSTVLPTRANSGTSQIASASAANLVVTGAIASAASTAFISIKGIVSINGGGTFTPQYTLSAAPGGAYSTMAGSYFLIYPIDASGSDTSVGTWAA